jgi:hypothetical protein
MIYAYMDALTAAELATETEEQRPASTLTQPMIYAHTDGAQPLTATELAAQAEAMERSEALRNRGLDVDAASTTDSATPVGDGGTSASRPGQRSGCECGGRYSAFASKKGRRDAADDAPEMYSSAADAKVDTRPATAIEAANQEVRKGLAYRGRDKVLAWSASSLCSSACEGSPMSGSQTESERCEGEASSEVEESGAGERRAEDGTRENPVLLD